MQKGGIKHNGVEDEIRCEKCGHFVSAVRPYLHKGQRVIYICKKCKYKGAFVK